MKASLSLKIFGVFVLEVLGYVYTGSDMFRSVWNRSHSGTDTLCLHGTGSKLERYGSTKDHLHKWTHLVPDSRSDPYQIHQVPCKHKVYPGPISYRFQTDPVPCKRCLSFGHFSCRLFEILHLLNLLRLCRQSVLPNNDRTQ